MIVRSRIRIGCLTAALFAAALSAGGTAWSAPKHLAPVPSGTLALMAARNTSPGAPILFRSYKKEAEIEVWKQARDGRYVFLKSFPICRWSGQLGPKRQQGDRQAPEGFYSVAPGQMNPNSSYHLSFNIGYPNAYDRAHGASGSHLMVHGACSSAGCFAMTDAAVSEIYALAREALAGGQRAFQFQAYPFRMTAQNMARYRSDPNLPFWRQLKEGSDRFEATGLEPSVGVAGGRYVFAPYRDPAKEALAAARLSEEETRTAALVTEGVASARVTYADGGQHPAFAAAARRGDFGEVSRPEALAFAGREIVIVPARLKPPVQVAAVPLPPQAPPGRGEAAPAPAPAAVRMATLPVTFSLPTPAPLPEPALFGREPLARESATAAQPETVLPGSVRVVPARLVSATFTVAANL